VGQKAGNKKLAPAVPGARQRAIEGDARRAVQPLTIEHPLEKNISDLRASRRGGCFAGASSVEPQNAVAQGNRAQILAVVADTDRPP
jgi:hypothetical protein